jgi:hypothetical protein
MPTGLQSGRHRARLIISELARKPSCGHIRNSLHVAILTPGAHAMVPEFDRLAGHGAAGAGYGFADHQGQGVHVAGGGGVAQGET